MSKRIHTESIDEIVLACMWSMLPHGTVVTASVREIERRTLLSRGVISRSLTRLNADGKIRRLTRPVASLNAANRYQLVAPAKDSSPLWSRHVLGPSARAIYYALPLEPGLTVRDVSETVGCSLPTSRSALKKLVSAGIVDRDAKRRYFRTADADYIQWVENYFCSDLLRTTSRRIDKEQFVWNLAVGPRQRGPVLPSAGGTCKVERNEWFP